MTILEALVQLRDDLKIWVTNNLRVKVDKEDGKGLSSNDFTTEEKNKLAALDNSLSTLVGNVPVSEQIDAAIANKSDSTHTHDDRYYTESEIDTKLSGKANSSHGNHVPTTETANNTKFLRNDNTWQVVTPANIGAAASSHGTHVSYSTTAPVMDGTASAGSASTVARSDHKHPTDTSRAAASDLTALQALVGDTKVSTQIANAISGVTHPVTSVNSKTGAVSLTASDVGARPSSWTPTAAEVGAQEKHATKSCTLTTGGWSSLSQTVNVTGVTANNTVIVTPSPSSYAVYGESGVYCSAQADGKLTFMCVKAPTSNLIVNVLILD